jgi:hypothetical protein
MADAFRLFRVLDRFSLMCVKIVLVCETVNCVNGMK